MAETHSQNKYKEAGKKELVKSLYSQLPETKETQHAKELTQLYSQNVYRQEGRKEVAQSLYAHMPQTIETVFAQEVTKAQSDKFYKDKYNREKGKSSYTNMKTLPQVEHAMEVTKNQSDVGYRRAKEELHLYNTAPDRPDIVNATNAAKLASDVAYKSKSSQPVYSDGSVLDRPDILHATEVSKLASQVKYKEVFDRQLKGQKPHYNPLDCVSFRQTQAAAALASQVKYKNNQKPEGSSDLPNLLQLEHVLQASKLQSNVEYKKKY
ncbi:nebulette, partial [Austrofundulus limnaeus]|uniref:Nebulette n=1 Tax=Austrofundulus limnaeus TaxID=52670 RepID=A0A2I4AKP2_AUSLI